jgi:acylphosphatase
MMNTPNQQQQKICMHCFVTGHVQGVFFRASTREQAQRLNITGYARNLSDGRVEVLACGTPTAVQQLCSWLHHGPQYADVIQVDCTPVDFNDQPGFATH